LLKLALSVLWLLGAVTTTTTTVSYSGNSSTTAFSVPFKFIASTHLVVTKTTSNVATTLVRGVDYTVTGADSDNGGTVTCTTAPATGSTLTITRVTPVTQTTTFQPQGPLSVTSLRDALDKGIMATQEANFSATSLASRVSILETDVGVLQSDVALLGTLSGITPFALFNTANSWGGTQTFQVGIQATSDVGDAAAITAFSLINVPGIYVSSTGGAAGIKIHAGGELIENGGLTVSAGGLDVTGSSTLRSGLTVTTTSNGTAITATGSGTGAGSLSTGGASGGNGAVGLGTGAGTGIIGTGGSSAGVGGLFTPGAGATDAVVAVGNVGMTGSNPASTTGFSNRVTPANVPKAWANIADGASPSVSAGFNIASVSCSSKHITVTFATGIASGNYAVVVTRSGAYETASVLSQSSGSLLFGALDGATLAEVDICTSTGHKTNLVVLGLQ
jgi:hypothetical protein